MTMKQKIFQALVTERKQKTLAQLAAQLGTSEGTVSARISEIRDEGYAIYANKRTDKSGRTKTFYRHGSPRRSEVAAGRLLMKALKAA
jgi:predicted ArsR family transcriptional regulator